MLSVVIPSFNEERGVKGVLEHVLEVMRKGSIEGEVILVDDGSTDSTSAVASSCDGVSVLRHAENRGYGASLKTGIRHAKYETIFITDADGTYPNQSLPDLLSRFCSGPAEMVVGARTKKGAAIPGIRRPAKWFIGKLANYISGTQIPDVNSGMRIFRRETALGFFSLLPDGFSFTTTLTLALLANGYLVDYVEIDYRPRIGKSKIRPIHDTLNFGQLVLRTGLYFAPLKLFMPMTGFLFLLSLLWGFFSHLVLGRFADASTLVIVMAAFQIGAVGLVAELINQRVPKNNQPD
jgi:glycosyltransferase involved in cell wall biosynthesis